VAYGVFWGQIKEWTDVCKGKTKRDLTASQMSSSVSTFPTAGP
jgi:hypothetical protein